LHENAHEASGFIFDGYPRTVLQAQAFMKMLDDLFPSVRQCVVLFSIADDVVIERLCCRVVCQNKDCQAVYSSRQGLELCQECGFVLGKRADDEELSVKKRLAIYHEHEQGLINFYRSSNVKIIELDAAQSQQEVFECFLQNIDEK
jgi:adenylate kinase